VLSQIESTFSTTVRETYGASEFLVLASECGHGWCHVDGDGILAVSIRIEQVIIILGGGAGTSQLDLYVANSPAQWIELLAWGPYLGLALLFASRMFATVGLAGWTRLLFALAGILAIAGWSISMLGNLLSVSSLQSLGLLVCLPFWTILLLVAEAMTARLLRGRGRTADSALRASAKRF
jgi:hypothetical protein